MVFRWLLVPLSGLAIRLLPGRRVRVTEPTTLDEHIVPSGDIVRKNCVPCGLGNTSGGEPGTSTQFGDANEAVVCSRQLAGPQSTLALVVFVSRAMVRNGPPPPPPPPGPPPQSMASKLRSDELVAL